MNSVVDLLRRGAGLHHHGCDVQDFSRQLRTASQDQRHGKTSGSGGGKLPQNGGSYLADHPHALDVVGRQGLDLRRPLQEPLGLGDPCVEDGGHGVWVG